MMRWLPRILLLVTVAGVLAMHGIDAAPASAHDADSRQSVEVVNLAENAGHHADEPMPDVAGGFTITAPGNSSAGGALSLHHVAAACMVALAAVAVARARRLLTVVASTGTAIVHDVGSAVVRAIDMLLPPPEPGWVRLCVIRR